jgi:hypothetical protein
VVDPRQVLLDGDELLDVGVVVVEHEHQGATAAVRRVEAAAAQHVDIVDLKVVDLAEPNGFDTDDVVRDGVQDLL